MMKHLVLHLNAKILKRALQCQLTKICVPPLQQNFWEVEYQYRICGRFAVLQDWVLNLLPPIEELFKRMEKCFLFSELLSQKTTHV